MSLFYYKMVPKDFDTDEKIRLMNLSQIGLMISCLNYSWTNNGLPAETEEIRLALRLSPREFKEAWSRVEPCFPVIDGRRRNPRQEDERLEANAVRTERRKAGKAGAQAKQLLSKTQANGSIRASDCDYEADVVAEVILEHQEKPTTRPRDFLPPLGGNALSRESAASAANMLDALKEIYRRGGLPVSENHEILCLQRIGDMRLDKRKRLLSYVKWAFASGRWPTPAKTKSLLNLLESGDYDVEITARTLPQSPLGREPTAQDRAEQAFLASVGKQEAS